MNRTGNTANGVLIFLIYAMFIFFSLLIVVIGAKVYREVTDASADNANTRTVFSYISNKVRNNKREDAVRIEQRGGTNCLVIEGSGDLAGYETLIYEDDGSLLEYFGKSGSAPFSGDKIADAQEFGMEMKDGVLIIELTDSDGINRRMSVNTEL